MVHFITGHKQDTIKLSLLLSFLYSLLIDETATVAAIKSPSPIHHYSADFIFWSFGMIGFPELLSYFENRIPLRHNYTARGVSSVAPSLLVINRLKEVCCQ